MGGDGIVWVEVLPWCGWWGDGVGGGVMWLKGSVMKWVGL